MHMYYYPYWLHLLNLCSFTHYNNLPNIDDSKQFSGKIGAADINLWSLTRMSGPKGRKDSTENMVTYNYLTKLYDFQGKRYSSYDDVVNEAYKI